MHSHCRRSFSILRARKKSMSESNYQGRRAAPSAPERENPASRQKPRRTREPRRTGAVIGVVLLVIAALAAVAAAVILLVRSGTISSLLGGFSGADSAVTSSAGDSDAGSAASTGGGSADNQTGTATDPALTGVWQYDESTSYEFADDGSGTMHLPDTDYSYAYHVDGDRLYMDFESDRLSDATYTYSISGDTLTLVGGKGTAGGTYELTR